MSARLVRCARRLALVGAWLGVLLVLLAGLAGAVRADVVRTLVVRGRVLAADGAPLAGARVSARGTVTVSALTDDRGHYALSAPFGTLASLKRGPFTLEVRAEQGGRKLPLANGAPGLGLEIAQVPANGHVRVRTNTQVATSAIAGALSQADLATIWIDADFGGAVRPAGSIVLNVVDELDSEGRTVAVHAPLVAEPPARTATPPARESSRVTPRVVARVADSTQHPGPAPPVRNAPPPEASPAPGHTVPVTPVPALPTTPSTTPALPPAASDRPGHPSAWVAAHDSSATAMPHAPNATPAPSATPHAPNAAPAPSTTPHAPNATPAPSTTPAPNAIPAQLAPAPATPAPNSAPPPRTTPAPPSTHARRTRGKRGTHAPAASTVTGSSTEVPAAPGVTPPIANPAPPVEVKPIASFAPPARHVTEADTCACRLRGTVEIDWDRPLERDFPVELSLEGPAQQQGEVQMFIGSPREFRFGPLPCGDYRLIVRPQGHIRYTVARGDSVVRVRCTGGLTQVRVVLEPHGH